MRNWKEKQVTHAASLKDDANHKPEEKGEKKKGPEEGRVDGMGVDDEANGRNWDV